MDEIANNLVNHDVNHSNFLSWFPGKNDINIHKHIEDVGVISSKRKERHITPIVEGEVNS